MPSLSRITIYPIKSLDGCELSTATILPTGAIKGDRQFALVDEKDNFVNGKRFPTIHLIRANYQEDFAAVCLSTSTCETQFSLLNEREQIASWCSNVLEVQCRLIENTENGFPDDLVSPGPTLISTATLQRIGNWFDLDVPEVRRRMRANLEIDSPQAFWEDQLVCQSAENKTFSIGATFWRGGGICQRCVVPSRDSHSGKVKKRFAAEFSQQREQSLPAWSPSKIFDHYYRAAINTSLESLKNGNAISLGDNVDLSTGESF